MTEIENVQPITEVDGSYIDFAGDHFLHVKEDTKTITNKLREIFGDDEITSVGGDMRMLFLQVTSGNTREAVA